LIPGGAVVVVVCVFTIIARVLLNTSGWYTLSSISKATDRYTFSEGWLQNFKEPVAEGYIQVEHSSD
jgi:hypothetical protein